MKRTQFVFFIYLFFIFFAESAICQVMRIEAETATLSDGAVVQADSNASGGWVIAQLGGKLTFNLNFDEEGTYNVYIQQASPNGNKYNLFAVDGTSIGFSTVNNSSYTRLKVINLIKLSAGLHTIEIIKSWGWINIDFIEFEKADPSTRFNTNKKLVTPEPTDEALRLYQFLYDNYGKKIISGVSTIEEADWLKANTGKYPALAGLDFLFCGRGYTWYDDNLPFNQGKAWYAKNGIVNFHWHWRDPSRLTEEFYTDNTSFDISKIFDTNSAEYAAMISDIDFISGQLKRFQDNKIPIIWRPLHEAAGGWFWWGAKGAAPCKKLWQVMFDRMVNVNGLHNLIWVWTREPDDDDWYPGDQYVDIVGRDIYKDGDHSSQVLEFNDMVDRYQGKKMITISESGSFPDVDKLISDAAGWSWFMPWNGKYTRDASYNSIDLWKKAFASDYVITLDEMPAISKYPIGVEYNNSPSVGVIRWDGWVGNNGSWQIGPIVERTLGPARFHYRAPFFSIVTAEDSIKIDGTTQAIVDKEIEYAKNAGIDYWAYCWYPDGCGLEAARKLHQSSIHANDVNWCVILGGFEENVSNNYGTTLVNDFARENYQKVLGGRPLVYLYGSDLTKTGLDKLRSMCAEKFIKTPYVVVMDWGAGSAASYCNTIGADAVSSYAALGSNNLPFAEIIPPQSIANWESFALQKPVVPWVSTGWNCRPRMDSPNPWTAYYSDATNCQDASANDIKEFLLNAIDWTNSNRDKALANTIIMYAWNEHDEGFGAICPTLGPDGMPVTERLDSVRSALSGRVKDTIQLNSFVVDISVLDFKTRLPVPGVKISLYSRSTWSDSKGLAQFNNVPGFFLLSAGKDHYLPVEDQIFSISSDTSITIFLNIRDMNVRFTLQDKKTLEKFWGVKVYFGNVSGVSDINGEIVFSVVSGSYDYSINKISYKTETGSLTINSDSVFIFNLEQINASAKFRLSDGSSPVNNAKIRINLDSLITNSIGIAQFKELIPGSSYRYFISKTGYYNLTDEFYLDGDTVIDISLEKNTTGMGPSFLKNDLKVWPNPAYDFLNFSFPESWVNSGFEITDLLGNRIYYGVINEIKMSLNLRDYHSGAYFLSVLNGTGHNCCLFFKR